MNFFSGIYLFFNNLFVNTGFSNQRFHFEQPAILAVVQIFVKENNKCTLEGIIFVSRDVCRTKQGRGRFRFLTLTSSANIARDKKKPWCIIYYYSISKNFNILLCINFLLLFESKNSEFRLQFDNGPIAHTETTSRTWYFYL